MCGLVFRLVFKGGLVCLKAIFPPSVFSVSVEGQSFLSCKDAFSQSTQMQSNQLGHLFVPNFLIVFSECFPAEPCWREICKSTVMFEYTQLICVRQTGGSFGSTLKLFFCTRKGLQILSQSHLLKV